MARRKPFGSRLILKINIFLVRKNMLKKSWYIEGYTLNGAAYCRDCVAETLNDDSLSDPYTTDEANPFKPVFASDVEREELEDMWCEYCFESLAK